MRLIDADAVLREIDKGFDQTDPSGEEQIGFLRCRRIVREAPTIAPSIHAHWIINGEWAECSGCHEDEKIAVLVHRDYCPACGAIMDEEAE